jgi:acetyl esterase
MKNNLLKPIILAFGTAVSLSACVSETKNTNVADSSKIDSTQMASLKPAGPAPEWGKTIKPEMQVVIEKLNSYGDKPIETLNAADARKNHTPTDAVMDVAKQNNIAIPLPKVDTRQKQETDLIHSLFITMVVVLLLQI